MPLPEAVLNIKVAVNSDGFPDCQLPSTVSLAEVWAITFPSESRSFIGKTPSFIQPAGTAPVTFSGLLTFELTAGVVTIGCSGVGDAVGTGVGASVVVVSYLASFVLSD